MNPKIIKYFPIISYLAFCLFNFFYFYPHQEKFYLASDIKSMEANNFITLFQILFFVIGFVIIIFRHSITFLSNTTKVFLSAFILFLGISQKSIMSLILFSNRLSEKGIVDKKYLVGNIAGSPLSRKNFHLLDLESNKITSDEKLLSLVYNDKLKARDTITVPLKFGFWKIEFLEGK